MNIAKIVHALPPFFRRHKLVKFLLKLSPGSRIQLVSFNGNSKLYADVSDPYTRSYLFVEGFEPEFFSIASPFLSNGGVFFDVGANFGFCSFGLIGSLCKSDVEYHLFEANPEICKALSRSAKLHPDKTIYINHCCVTNIPGISKLLMGKDNFGSSFISDKGTTEVKNLILDNYIAQHSLRKINLLKIDIEGWEVLALTGAQNALKAGVVETIYTEASTENLARAGFSTADYFSLLQSCGFRLFYIKSVDFDSSTADNAEVTSLDIHGHKLTVFEMKKFPSQLHTDILAIHNSSNLLKKL